MADATFLDIAQEWKTGQLQFTLDTSRSSSQATASGLPSPQSNTTLTKVWVYGAALQLQFSTGMKYVISSANHTTGGFVLVGGYDRIFIKYETLQAAMAR